MRFIDRKHSVIVLPPGIDVFLRFASRAILLVAIVLFTYEALQGNIPRDPEGGPFTEDFLVPLQLGLLALTAIGLLLSFRWMAVAAAIVALGGVGLGVLATLQYEPPFGFFVVLAFLVPAIMMWLDWQHQETWGKIAVLAASTTVLVLGSWLGANEVYATFLGPAHPQSSIAALPDSPVRWLWSGAVETDGFSVTARLRNEAESVELVVRGDDGREVARSRASAVPDTREPVTLAVDGLEPATSYQYAVAIDGEIDEIRVGQVQTFPSGAASFTVAVAACARTNSNGSVFDIIRETAPDLYINAGDLHYRNIADNSTSEFRTAYAQVHASAAQAALYRSVPIAYVWDDHDFGPNDADSSSPSRPAAWASYRSHVPHYGLPSGDEGPINQAFTMGRVRFILTDTRSERAPGEGVLLGETQLQWFLDEVLAARDTYALTVWVSPTPWIGDDDPSSDGWGGYGAERRLIGEFLDQHDITNLVMVAGDAHMVGIDDGTNSGYGGHEGFPVLHAAALDRPGNVKGGPYSHPTFPGAGQFGLVEVTDTGGGHIDVSLVGRNYEGEELLRLDLTYDVPGGAPAL
ncbi:MAG: alkaline phosphatase family protein [Actinomycetia bacterium]|nr:alkaline phosphatase family protein [Actinomycetes bacterium]